MTTAEKWAVGATVALVGLLVVRRVGETRRERQEREAERERPVPVVLRITEDRILTEPAILYRSRRVSPTVRMVRAIARLLVDRPDLRILIWGHATPDEPEPERIAALRAARFADSLVGEGIDPNRIAAEGRGADDPEYRPPTDPRNRRLEFWIQ